MKHQHTVRDTADFFIKKMKGMTDILPEFIYASNGHIHYGGNEEIPYIDYFSKDFGLSFWYRGILHGVLHYRRNPDNGIWYVMTSFGIDNHLEFNNAVWRLNNNRLN